MAAPANALFVWNPGFALGMDEVDAQHRNLFRLGGELESQVTAGAESAAMAPLVRDLVASVRNHFDAEEALMRAQGAEGYWSHRVEHQEFLVVLTAFASEFEAGRATVTAAVLQVVHDWILKHIAGADRVMAAQLAGTPDAPPRN